MSIYFLSAPSTKITIYPAMPLFPPGFRRGPRPFYQFGRDGAMGIELRSQGARALRRQDV